MFQKKDYVVTSAQGVCIVADVPKLVVGKEQQMQYYLLQSIVDKKKRCYIPVEKHETAVRAVMTKGEALELKQFLRDRKTEILQEIPDKETAKGWLESATAQNWGRAGIWLMEKEGILSGEVLEYLTKARDNLLQELNYVFREEEEEVLHFLKFN